MGWLLTNKVYADGLRVTYADEPPRLLRRPRVGERRHGNA